MRVSLIIPLRNEEKSFPELAETILAQTVQPFETIFVDAGSVDHTAKIIEKFCTDHSGFILIKEGPTMPGKARNIGAVKATGDWIAFTDGGIRLDKDWLKELVAIASVNDEASLVYGNYHPRTESLFTKCAAIAYCSPLKPDGIRGKFIASSLMRKEIWEKAGSFPDWRAAEDLIFMRKAEQAANNKFAIAPKANVYWSLRTNLKTTFKRFDLYSKFNVWAKQQKYWHYGVLKQYICLALVIAFAVFHSIYWLLLIPVFYFLRTAKRIHMHKWEFGKTVLYNPAIYFQVFIISLIIDAATFSGWLKAIFNKSSLHQPSAE